MSLSGRVSRTVVTVSSGLRTPKIIHSKQRSEVFSKTENETLMLRVPRGLVAGEKSERMTWDIQLFTGLRTWEP